MEDTCREENLQACQNNTDHDPLEPVGSKGYKSVVEVMAFCHAPCSGATSKSCVEGIAMIYIPGCGWVVVAVLQKENPADDPLDEATGDGWFTVMPLGKRELTFRVCGAWL